MAKSLLSVLDELQSRIIGLQEEISTLRSRNSELEAANAELREKTREAIDDRDKALLDAQYLSVSHRLADSPDTIIETRRIIAGLIRNIDQCIAMLKE